MITFDLLLDVDQLFLGVSEEREYQRFQEILVHDCEVFVLQ